MRKLKLSPETRTKQKEGEHNQQGSFRKNGLRVWTDWCMFSRQYGSEFCQSRAGILIAERKEGARHETPENKCNTNYLVPHLQFLILQRGKHDPMGFK